MFIHLNVKSNFSFGHGASTVDELLARAVELEMSALALTDLNGMYAAVPFAKKAKELGIKPILGTTLDDPSEANLKAVLLAKNLDGFSEICRLITVRRLEENFSLPERLKSVSPNVFIISGNVDILKACEHLKYRGQLFGEIIYHSQLDKPKCRAIGRFCNERSIPMTATNAAAFARSRDYPKHHLLSAIFQNTSMKKAKRSAGIGSHLKSAAEMSEIFQRAPELIRNSVRIAEQCDVDLELGRLKFPQYPLPGGESPFEHLKELSEAGLRRRYGESPGQDAISRLAYEIGVIDRLGFTEYFLIVYDIKQKAVEWGMPFVGRGSAANSIVSYCLGFTEVDPIEHNLYFERFLNPYRKSPPDIDLDFSWKDRDRVLNYVYDRYGRERVAMICTTVTFAFRAAVRETAKVMGLSEAEIGRVTKRIPHYASESFDKLRENNPLCAELPVDIEPWKTVFRLAQGILGYPRHLSIHPGGIVIAPGRITDWVPLERARKGFVVTQYDMYPIEDIGLVKIDLLAQRSLGVLTDTLSAVKLNCGCDPPVDDFKAITSDAKTRGIVRSGETMGCFYIESPGMRALLKKLGCETFELLTAASSVIRPGVAESGMMKQFIERHRGEAEIEYLHPKMRELLGETYGVMIYQEDVIKVAHHIAGISLGEADLLRRAMSGKERSSDKMKAMEDKFLRGCITKGVSSDIALEIWRQVESFAGYAFCKAHSASFAVLSFKVAYLKAHYPAEFIAAVLSNGGGYYGPGVYIEEAKRLGLKVLLPDINLSEKDYTGRGDEIRIGFGAIKNLHNETIERILECRRDNFYSSLADFMRRTNAGAKETALLIKSGAFDFIGVNRPSLLWKLEALKDRVGAWGGLFDYEESLLEIPPPLDYDERKKFELECEIFGYPVSRHPLEFIPPEGRGDIIEASEIEAHKGQRVRMLGWAISHKRIKTKNKGEYMKFLSLEDMSGTFEVTMFPKIYQKYAAETMGQGPYLVEGRIEDDSGVLSLVADKVSSIKCQVSSVKV
ncbi:MAG: DNA polymerase III subunit alpha [candidate division Zixibacteria bacterium]|nr:DNA polymerase III subunit alpha [Candidatus Tariuqbacter arcticus]